MPRELSPDAELVPGRYALEIELPDQMLDAIHARPNWRARLAREINELATANVRIIGSGVQHNSPDERVFAIAFEVIDPYADSDDPHIQVAVLPVVPVAVIVASISAVLVVSISGHYTVKVLGELDDPSGAVSDAAGAAQTWGVVAALALGAWILRGSRAGVTS